MADLPRPHLVVYGLLALAIVAIALRHLTSAGTDSARPVAAPEAAIRIDRQEGSGARIVVHVAGAVRRPGVYRLRAGARVDDAVRRAGGVRDRADLTQLNLAAKLEDGRQVLVPRRPPSSAAAAVGGTPPVGGAAGAAPPGPINLNTATAEQLDTLDGVGPVTVEKILQYRQEHGGFSSVEELAQIPGIGERRLAALREQVAL